MNDDEEVISELYDALMGAKIFAGAIMERLCNRKEYSKAVYFQSLRDSLGTQLQAIESYCKIENIEIKEIK